MRTHLFAASIAFISLVAGCGGAVKAPSTAGGGTVTIFLLSDYGIKDTMTDQEKSERNEVGAWLTEDMTRILTEGGYAVSTISTKEDFTPAKNAYMVLFTIEHFRPGRMSTREEAGLGEGVVELDTMVELYKDNATIPVLQKTQGSATGRDWEFAAGEVNKKAAPAISERINELN